MLHYRTLAVGLTTVLASACLGNVTVVLTQNGTQIVWSSYPSGAPISDLPMLDDSYSKVQVYATGSDDIGTITLNGTRSVGSMLDLVVSTSAAPPVEPSTLFGSAGRHWHGLITSSGMKDQVRLAASITGEIDADVAVGRIDLLRAGAITGNVSAGAGDSGTLGAAIKTIEVTSRITGSVVATSGGVKTLLVGTAQDGDGLFGSVIAAGGTIEVIRVAGEINIAAPGKIEARDGINSIRVFAGDGQGGPLSATINADAGLYTGGDTTTGALMLLECGDFSGVITARHLDNGLNGPDVKTIRAGAFSGRVEVSSDCYGGIDIDHMEEGSSITIYGNLYASLHAAGDMSSITVAGDVDNLSVACIPSSITSDTGRIGSILIGGNMTKSTGCEEYSRIWAPDGIETFACAGDCAALFLSPIAVHAPMALGTFRVDGNLYGGMECASFDTFEVRGSLFMNALFASIPGDKTVLIGGEFRSDSMVLEPFQGQIIFNANGGTPATDFGGAVWVHIPSTTNYFTMTNTPFYTRTSGELGGGSIGFAPFHLHRQDMTPFSACEMGPCVGGVPIIDQNEFESAAGSPLTLRFYGPVTAAPGGASIHLFKGDPWGRFSAADPADYGSNLSVDFVDNRTIRVRGVSHINPGRYILSYGGADASILCDDLFTSAPVPVAPFTYHFILSPGFSGTGGDHSCADFDGDGDVGTDPDIEAFFACLAGTCCVNCATTDVNNDDHFGTDQDIEEFFRYLAGVPCN